MNRLFETSSPLAQRNRKGDVETVLNLMSEDVAFLVPGKPLMRGGNSFEQGLRGLLTQHRIESTGGDVQEVEVT